MVHEVLSSILSYDVISTIAVGVKNTERDTTLKCVKRGRELPKSEDIVLYSSHPIKKVVMS